MEILKACHLSLETSRVLYLTADVHHYERQAVGESLHVIAGGGGAFLHGSRIAPAAGSAPPVVVYPDKQVSRRLAFGMPLQLALGTAGFLPHGVFALLAMIDIGAVRRGPVLGAAVVILGTLAAIVALSLAVRARATRPAATWGIAVPFGLALGLLPVGLYPSCRARLPGSRSSGRSWCTHSSRASSWVSSCSCWRSWVSSTTRPSPRSATPASGTSSACACTRPAGSRASSSARTTRSGRGRPSSSTASPGTEHAFGANRPGPMEEVR